MSKRRGQAAAVLCSLARPWPPVATLHPAATPNTLLGPPPRPAVFCTVRCLSTPLAPCHPTNDNPPDLSIPSHHPTPRPPCPSPPRSPLPQYAPWYSVVRRCAHAAVRLCGWLGEAGRAAKLSFVDLVGKLAALPKDDPAYISSKVREMQVLERQMQQNVCCDLQPAIPLLLACQFRTPDPPPLATGPRPCRTGGCRGALHCGARAGHPQPGEPGGGCKVCGLGLWVTVDTVERFIVVHGQVILNQVSRGAGVKFVG